MSMIMEMFGGSRTSNALAHSGQQLRSIENPTEPLSPTMLDSLLSYGPTRSGVQVNEESAMTHAAVFAAVRILSDAIGMLPLLVYQPAERGQSVARNHPTFKLLRKRPNSEMTASVWKETMQASLSLWGNAYSRIVFNRGGQVKEILPILPNRIWPERKAGKLCYRTERGETFAKEEILHVPGLAWNGVKGLSPISYARESIGLGLAAQIFGATFFGNGTNLGGVLTHPGHMSDQALRNLRDSFEMKFRGVGNSNRPIILEEGVKWQSLGIPPDDAQFLETRKFQVLEVARIFRVPPHMLADLERATFSNIEQQGMDFVTYSLSPWLEKWEQELDAKLFPDGDYSAQFDLRLMLRGDKQARYAAYAIGRNWGWLSPNDVREDEGMNLMDSKDGDTYLTPLNMVVDGQHAPGGKTPAAAGPDTAPAQVPAKAVETPAPQSAPQEMPVKPPKRELTVSERKAIWGLLRSSLGTLIERDALRLERAAEKGEAGKAFCDRAMGDEHRREFAGLLGDAAVTVRALLGGDVELVCTADGNIRRPGWDEGAALGGELHDLFARSAVEALARPKDGTAQNLAFLWRSTVMEEWMERVFRAGGSTKGLEARS